jgi:hypothetical protein
MLADKGWKQLLMAAGLGVFVSAADVVASDWARFRGPNGTGISPDPEPLPVEFGADKNLKWKVALPGAGVSCPIVVGDRVFVTCYSGYGVSRQDAGEMQALKRHMVCLNRGDGKVVWERTIDAVLPEDDRAWGSSSSPILAGQVLVVPAGPESRAVIGYDVESGRELWKAAGDSLGNVWGTPALSVIDEQRTDVVIGAPYEIWGLNPATGKLRWYCTAMETDQFNSSVLIDGGTIYAVEGRGGGSIAIRAGGKGDVSGSNVVWSGNDSNRFSTPLLYEGRMYLISGGLVKSVNAADGKEIFQGRLTGGPAGGGGGAPGAPGAAGGGGRGRGGFGGGRGGSDYASPVLGDGRIYYVNRAGDIYVLKPGDALEVLAKNRLTSEQEDFSATPAISSGQLFFRSNRHLYCVSGQ